jgi:hypothetical protein
MVAGRAVAALRYLSLAATVAALRMAARAAHRVQALTLAQMPTAALADRAQALLVAVVLAALRPHPQRPQIKPL